MIAKTRSRHRRVSPPDMRTPFARMPLKNDVAVGEAAPAPHSRDPLGMGTEFLKKARAIVVRKTPSPLNLFTPRQWQIVNMRLGIGQRPHTLEEIGRHYGLTRERIRQIVYEVQKLSDPEFEQKERKRKRSALQTRIEVLEVTLRKLREKANKGKK